MADPRDREYAELIVGGCLDVQPGWQVFVGGNPQARPLLEEVCGAVARRGAYALLRVSFEGFLAQSLSWVADAPLELLEQPAGITVMSSRPSMRCSSSRRPTTRARLRRFRASAWVRSRRRIDPPTSE